MVYSVDGREYRIRGLSPVGLERLRVNLRLTLNGNFHLDTIDLYQARARSLFAQSAARLCGASEQQVSADLLRLIEKLEASAKYPHIPPVFMEDFKGAHDVAPSDVLAHELGEVAAQWGLIVGDRKHISVAFENEARRIRNPNAKLRTGHDEEGDARPENWKEFLELPGLD